MISLTTTVTPEELLRSAQNHIDYHVKQIIERRIRFEFTGDAYDKKQLDYSINELVIAENLMRVLTAKMQSYEAPETNLIIKGILGE